MGSFLQNKVVEIKWFKNLNTTIYFSNWNYCLRKSFLENSWNPNLCIPPFQFLLGNHPPSFENRYTTTEVMLKIHTVRAPFNPLLITNRSWIHKGRIFWKKLLQKMFLTFKKWVKNIQTAGYNFARTVYNTIF